MKQSQIGNLWLFHNDWTVESCDDAMVYKNKWIAVNYQGANKMLAAVATINDRAKVTLVTNCILK